MSHAALDGVFHALSDHTRRSIVEQLSRGEQTVMVLARRFDMSQPAVTKHLNVLERAGLITRHASGRTRICRLRPEVLSNSREWIDRMQQHWNQHLDALERFIVSRQSQEDDHGRSKRDQR